MVTNPAPKLARIQPAKIEAESTESKLKEFKIIAEHSPGMIDVYDYKTKQYVYVNPAVRYMLGYKPEDLLSGGLNFIISRIHPKDKNRTLKENDAACRAIEKFKAGTKDRQPFAQLEYRVCHKNGDWIWLKTYASVYSRDNSGALEYIINTCVDITEQKETEDKLRTLTKKLHESQELLRVEHKQLLELNNAKDDFLSIASHQLRTPATGVKQYVGMLLEGFAGELSAEQAAMLKTVYESNERQLRLINDLLKIVQIDAGHVKLKKKRFDLVGLFEDIYNDMHDGFSALNQELKIDYAKKPLVVSADLNFIRMVAENLLDNASKYSKKKQKITVSIASKDDFATFSIKDNGIGIAKKDHNKLFQKFSRIDSALTYSVSGTGLGLYWAKKLIDLHGGDIIVRSRKGKGTVFTVKLPLPAETNKVQV